MGADAAAASTPEELAAKANPFFPHLNPWGRIPHDKFANSSINISGTLDLETRD